MRRAPPNKRPPVCWQGTRLLPGHGGTGLQLTDAVAGAAGYGFANQETELVLTRFGGAPAGATFINGLTQWPRLARDRASSRDLQIGGNWLIGAFVDGDWRSRAATPARTSTSDSSRAMSNRWSWPSAAVPATSSTRISWTSSRLPDMAAGDARRGRLQQRAVPELRPANRPAGSRAASMAAGSSVPAPSTRSAGLPGLFWKNEVPLRGHGTRIRRCRLYAVRGTLRVVGPTIWAERNHAYTHTVRSELVLRFDFGGAGPPCTPGIEAFTEHALERFKTPALRRGLLHLRPAQGG